MGVHKIIILKTVCHRQFERINQYNNTILIKPDILNSTLFNLSKYVSIFDLTIEWIISSKHYNPHCFILILIDNNNNDTVRYFEGNWNTATTVVATVVVYSIITPAFFLPPASLLFLLKTEYFSQWNW